MYPTPPTSPPNISSQHKEMKAIEWQHSSMMEYLMVNNSWLWYSFGLNDKRKVQKMSVYCTSFLRKLQKIAV